MALDQQEIEKHRHQCFVRQLLKYRYDWGLNQYRKWIFENKDKKGLMSATSDFIKQFKLGNKGEDGDWRE